MIRKVAFYDEETNEKIGSCNVHFVKDRGMYSDTIVFEEKFGHYPNEMYYQILTYMQGVYHEVCNQRT